MPPKRRRDPVTGRLGEYNHGSEDEDNNPQDTQVIENPLQHHTDGTVPPMHILNPVSSTQERYNTPETDGNLGHARAANSKGRRRLAQFQSVENLLHVATGLHCCPSQEVWAALGESEKKSKEKEKLD